jgi:uncharacterized protein YheU (UPF0270 family)
MLEIPSERLSADALSNLIEDFVTRSGRNHDQDEFSAEQMIGQVQNQLDTGRLIIVFDEEIKSCTIMERNAFE